MGKQDASQTDISPDVEIITEELCIEIAQDNSQIHLCNSNQYGHLHF